MAACPVCGTELVNQTIQHDRYFYECPRCGSYSLSYEANTDLNWLLQRYDHAPTKLSHAINRITSRAPGEWPFLRSEQIKDLLENTTLPAPQQQLENFIQWLGNAQPGPGKRVEVSELAEAATGVTDYDGLRFIVGYAMDKGLVAGNLTPVYDVAGGMVPVLRISPSQLTFDGWEYFYSLQKGHSASRQAFMAMKFGDDQLDGVYRDHFKAAVEATGFNLKRLDEGQPAGLIDDRLRVEIRQSRFLIADLTHHNKGAYWEAGYAEGLGKPVIYTCRKDAFDAGEVHFDTNHHLTVIWEQGKEGEAVEKLKATIRATLPDEAKLED